MFLRLKIGKPLISFALREFEWHVKHFATRLLPQNFKFNIQSIYMGVDHQLLLQPFLIVFYLFYSKIRKTWVWRFHLTSGSCLDYQCDFHTLPTNPQQILVYNWYIFKIFIRPSFQIQNTIRLSLDIEDSKFNHYLNSPNS